MPQAPAGAARLCPQPSQQFAGGKWFRNVVVSAAFESHDEVRFFAEGAGDHDRKVDFLSQASTHLEAMNVGKHQIEQDNIGAQAKDSRDALAGVVDERDEHAVAF